MRASTKEKLEKALNSDKLDGLEKTWLEEILTNDVIRRKVFSPGGAVETVEVDGTFDMGVIVGGDIEYPESDEDFVHDILSRFE